MNMGTDDWQMNKTLWQCTKHMLENEIDCDVNFRIGDEAANIKAHKMILRLRSPVFDRMFSGAFQESEKDPVIPDVSPAAFYTLLRYCYYECLDIEDDVALPVLYAAKKYMLPLLEKAAREKLVQVMDVSNVWDIFKYASSVGDTKLDKLCQKYFEGGISLVRSVLHSEDFLSIPHQALLQFLTINNKVDELLDSKKKFDPFTIKPGISMAEIELFKVCNAWAAAECHRQGMAPNGANKRTVLGECLFKICFPTMLYKDLVNIVYPTGILTQTEKDNLCLYNHQQTDSQCRVDFPAKERPFIVTTGGRSYNSPPKSMVLVRSDVRVELSRIWIQDPGRWTVTVRDEKSGESWSMRRPARYEEHCLTDLRCTQLYFLDIKPYLFEAQSKYFITVEAFGNAYPPERNIDNIQFVKEGEVSPYEEVKITRSTQMENTIYALTLRLV